MLVDSVSYFQDEQIYKLTNGILTYRGKKLNAHRTSKDHLLHRKIIKSLHGRQLIRNIESYEYRFHSLDIVELNMFCFVFESNRDIQKYLTHRKLQ